MTNPAHALQRNEASRRFIVTRDRLPVFLARSFELLGILIVRSLEFRASATTGNVVMGDESENHAPA